MVKQWVMGNSDHVGRNNVLWNMVASVLAAGQSALMLIIVNRTVGIDEAGVFTLAYSIAQMMQTVGHFDMRSYQVTDVKKELEFKYYLSSRVITCVLMMLVSAFYVFMKHYTGDKAVIILLVCFFKMFDSLEDVIHALFQKRGRLDVAGRLQSLRYMLIIVVFALTLIVSKNMMAAVVVSIVISAIVVFGMNLPLVKDFACLKLDFDFKELKKLFAACLPLFVGSYLALYMENSPKYAIDTYLTSADQAYYGMLAMMAFVVNLFSSFAFRPMLTPLAISWTEKKYKRYVGIVCKLLIWVAGLTVVIAFGAYLLGIPVLSLVYGEDLSPFRWMLVIIIVAGGINSFGTILYYSLTTMRRQNLLLGGYILTAIAAYFVAPYFVSTFGLMGAAWAFALVVTIRSMIFVGIFIYAYSKREK